MLGFNAIGKLAIGQVPAASQTVTFGSGNARLRLTAQGGGIALSVSGSLRAKLSAKAAPSLSVGGSIRTAFYSRAPWSLLATARPLVRITLRLEAPTVLIAGAGKNYATMPWLPQPDYEAPRRKSFQPIWDRLRQQRLEEARRKAAEPPPPPPLPPRSIFPAIVTLKLDTQLDHLARLIPGDWRQLERSVHEAEDATDAEFVLRAVVEADVSDVADAFSAIQSTADQMLATALQEAAKPQPPKRIEIAIPPHSGTRSYHEQMQDVTDHADAMAALREGGIIPGEA